MTIRIRGIETEWQAYRQEVLPKDASYVQIVECKRAFLAGCLAYRNLVSTMEGVETPRDVELLCQRLDGEMSIIAERITRGQV